MKSGFSDPIKAKVKEEVRRNPWNFDAPAYDERSSCFVNAGTHYGVGRAQPVGHKGNPKTTASTLPSGKVKTMRDDEVG